jgi:hypothetical protein
VDAWEDESSRSRCTATHVFPGADGDMTVRCDGQAGHAGPGHQGHVGAHTVHWTDEQRATNGGGTAPSAAPRSTQA